MIAGLAMRALIIEDQFLIATLIEDFQQDNEGRLPARMSQLAPLAEGLRIFYFRCRVGSARVPANAETQPGLIDLFSPYAFVPLPDGRVVVFERVRIWQDDERIGYCLTSSDFREPPSAVERVTPQEFADKFLATFAPSHPEP